jgi:hypothetical protein
MATESFPINGTARQPWQSWDDGQFFADIIECCCGGGIEDREYRRIEEESRRHELTHWELWQSLAQHLQRGVSQERDPRGMPLGGGEEQENMRKRILSLMGRLPQESLGEFRSLVNLLSGFLQRAEFVCQMVVYLFSEREKGPGEWEEVQAKRYTDFFSEKLMWELSKIQQLGDCKSLADVDEQYRDWLMDRMIGGEVLV